MFNRFCFFIIFVFFSTSALAEDISIAISEGMDRDVESATQRAAEAALTQVVGSFIDSSKMVEKRKEIRDGIKSQTKNVTSKISEYSQGSIQSIEVLEVVEEGGFVRVTAKVAVRIEDFKNYIKETVLAEKEVKTGLLSKIKIKEKQAASASDLVVGNILKEILSYQVIEPVINGEIEEITDPELIGKANQNIKGEGYLVKIPVKASVKSGFLENTIRTLDEVAGDKYEGSEISQVRVPKSLYAIFIGDFVYNRSRSQYDSLQEVVGSGNYLYSLMAAANSPYIKVPEMLYTYIFPEKLSLELCKATEVLGEGNYNIMNDMFVPNVKASFLSESGEVLRKETLTAVKTDSETPLKSRYSFLNPTYKGEMDAATLKIFIRRGIKCMVFIDTASEYSIITKVSEDVLGNTDKVVLKYVAPRLKERGRRFYK